MDSRPRAHILRIAISVVLVGLVAGFALASRSAIPMLFDDETIVEGVTVAGFDLGGVSREEARRRLEGYANACLSAPIELRLGEEAWIMYPSDIGTHFNVDAAVSGAYEVGRTGSIFSRYAQRKQAAREGIEIPLLVSTDQQQLMDTLYSIAAEVRMEPVDAQLTFTQDDQVLIKPSTNGRGLIARQLPELLRQATLSLSRRSVELPIETIRPTVSTSDLEALGLRKLIGKYTTKFTASNYKRTVNVRLGAEKIDGTIIAPGVTFSFNEVVGPRTVDRGFLEADVIVNSELVPGVGGGICQVSTTLYNAVLLAGLEIRSRMNHSLPVAYVPLGRDATVSYGAIDFQFRNNTERHVMIKASTDTDTITVKVFGDVADGMSVKIMTEVTDTIAPSQIQRVDPAAAPGSSVVTEKGAPGYKVSVYRVFELDGAEQRRELVSNDRYKPKPSVLTVGPSAPSTSAPLSRAGSAGPSSLGSPARPASPTP